MMTYLAAPNISSLRSPTILYNNIVQVKVCVAFDLCIK